MHQPQTFCKLSNASVGTVWRYKVCVYVSACVCELEGGRQGAWVCVRESSLTYALKVSSRRVFGSQNKLFSRTACLHSKLLSDKQSFFLNDNGHKIFCLCGRLIGDNRSLFNCSHSSLKSDISSRYFLLLFEGLQVNDDKLYFSSFTQIRSLIWYALGYLSCCISLIGPIRNFFKCPFGSLSSVGIVAYFDGVESQVVAF